MKKVLAEEYGYDCSALRLSASQRNRIIREDLKFEMRSSHGACRVYVTIGHLIARRGEWSVDVPSDGDGGNMSPRSGCR